MNSYLTAKKANLPAVSSLVMTALLVVLGAQTTIGGCGLSPEALKKDRSDKLEGFAKTVTEHLLDKNPATLKNSITTFMRDEVNDPERDKLQEQKIIPDSPISVERIEQENQAAGRSNQVTIESVKALTPIDKDSVNFQVIGKEVLTLNGKVTDTKPFDYELTILLNPEMSGYPRLTDLKGLTAPAATADSSAPSSKSTKKSRRRRG